MGGRTKRGRRTVADRVGKALARKILSTPDPEDAKRCELLRFILSKLDRFECPAWKAEWPQKAAGLRRRFLKDVYLRGHPKELLRAKPRVWWTETIETSGGYRIRKLRYEGYPGMWIPALLYEPDRIRGRVPAVLNPNGHHAGGKAMEYKQARCINLAKRGMLALNTEFIGMGELTMDREHNRIGHLDVCGVAGVGVFYLAMKRGLDVLLAHPRCDPDRVAMTGLSGGGWQTAVLSALDERIRVTIPVAGHSPIWQRASCQADIGDLEQVPADICSLAADFDTLTALFAPRPALLIYNLRDDCCFRSRKTRLSVYNPVRPLYEVLGVPEHIQFYENRFPGTHNYEADNRSQLYRFLNRHFGLETPEEDVTYEDEVLSASQLEVGLPEDNATLLSLAKEASRDLPRLKLPGGRRKTHVAWVRTARKTLQDVIRLRAFRARDQVMGVKDGVVYHRLRLSNTWTIPVTEFAAPAEVSRGEPQLVIADGGRRSTTAAVVGHIAQGRHVFAADVFGTGEAPYPPRLQMLLSVTGERPLGILVGQILALVQWASRKRRGKKIRLSAIGPVTSFGALCAAALEPGLFAHLHLDGMEDSLKRLIELPIVYDNAIPLFCFGLLRELDVPELLAMTEGLPIERPNHGPVQPAVGQG